MKKDDLIQFLLEKKDNLNENKNSTDEEKIKVKIEVHATNDVYMCMYTCTYIEICMHVYIGIEFVMIHFVHVDIYGRRGLISRRY